MTTVTADATQTAARLRLSATRLARLLRQSAGAGLTPTQLSALATLHRCGPIPIGNLAEEEQVGAPTATKTVDKLHAAGYVERHPDPADRRVTRVGLSPTGADLLAEVRARKTAWLSHRLEELAPADLAALDAALDVLDRVIAPRPPPPPDQ